jgi:hypothetical protein
MTRLRRGLHERCGDPHELCRDLAAGDLAGLVERRGRLLRAAGDGVGHRGLAEGQGIVGVGLEEGPARGGRLGESLRGQFELRARGHQAGAAGRLLVEPPHLVERRGDLVALHERVELLEIAHQVGTAELDLLAGAAGAGRVGVDGHA